MLNNTFRTGAMALGLIIAGAAHATVTFNPDTGAGFVGKGDVQYTFDWNNAALQKTAGDVQFRAVSTVVTEVSWICTNDKNENTQERERTTTTEKAGVVSSVARVKNQITGFILESYSGEPTQSATTDGPELDSCPSKWTLTTPAADPVVVSSSSSLEVSNDSGTSWVGLKEAPAP